MSNVDSSMAARLWARLHRIERRMESGFSQLGVSTNVDPDPSRAGDSRHMTVEDVWHRLSRVETRMVNGFIGVGVDPTVKIPAGEMIIDVAKREVTIATKSLTIDALHRRLSLVGAPDGVYKIIIDGRSHGGVVYQKEVV